MSNELAQWLAREIESRGWSIRETARRAGVSHTPIANILSEQGQPGLSVLTGLADAFDIPRDYVFRLAGALPSLPEEVEDEREATNLFRQLAPQLRKSILTTMRNLLGVETVAAPNPSSTNDEPSDEPDMPRTFAERQAYRLASELEHLPPDDQQLVFDLMKRLRRVRESTPSRAPTKLETD